MSRHDVAVSAPDPAAPLTVGNGEFAFTADVTGLQTLNATYAGFPPLQTMSHWGWHKAPPAAAGASPPRYAYQRVTVAGHSADYATNTTATPEYGYLRGNPHRINLARVFLRRAGPAGAARPGGCRAEYLATRGRLPSDRRLLQLRGARNPRRRIISRGPIRRSGSQGFPSATVDRQPGRT